LDDDELCEFPQLFFRTLSFDQDQYDNAPVCPLPLAQRFRSKLGGINNLKNLEDHAFDLVFPYLSDFDGDRKRFHEYARYLVRLFSSYHEKATDENLWGLLDKEADLLRVFQRYQNSMQDGEWPSYSRLYSFFDSMRKDEATVTQKFESLMNERFESVVKDPYDVVSSFFNKLASDSRKWANIECNIHSPYFALFGPSLAGKSFLLRQLSYRKDIYVVYICFRPENLTGVPPSTPYLAEALGRGLELDRASQTFLSFFVKIFEIVEADSSKDSSTFNQKWIENDEEFLKEIFDCLRGKETKRDAGMHQDFGRRINTLWEKIVLSKPWLSKSLPAIVFAFDETRILLKNTRNANVFSTLRSCLQILPRNGFREIYINDDVTNAVPENNLEVHAPMAVMTDTVAGLGNISTACDRDPSARVSNNTLNLLRPFNRFKFVDIFEDKAPVSISNLTDQTRLFRYGRPFWGSMIESIIDR
jgi:hypothetical protein